MRQVPSISSRNPYLAMIQLDHKIKSEWTRHTAMFRDGNAYTEAIPTVVEDFGGLVPADEHPPLVLRSIVGAD